MWGRGEVGLSFTLFNAMPSAIASAPGPAVSEKENRGSCDLNKNEQMFHAWSASSYNA